MDDLTIYITWETQLQIEWMDLFVSLNWNKEGGGTKKKKVSYIIVSATGMIGSFLSIGGIESGTY